MLPWSRCCGELLEFEVGESFHVSQIRFQRLLDVLSNFVDLACHSGLISKLPFQRRRQRQQKRRRRRCLDELAHALQSEVYAEADQHAFVSFRNSKSSSASDPHEIEANQFAAALLMPEAFLRACLDQLGENPDVEESIRRLAQRFDVSAQAMTIRLTSLGEITPAFG